MGQQLVGAARTKVLEHRLRRAQALLSKLQTISPSTELQKDIESIFETPPGSPSYASDTSQTTDNCSGDHLENMMDGRGWLTSDNGSTTYYGGGSGFAFLQQTRQLFDQDSSRHKRPANRHLSIDAISKLFDSPLPDKQALTTNVPISELLPGRQTAREFLHVVFRQTYPLLQFLHEPTFQEQTDRVYDLDPTDFEDCDHDFFPLFYSVTALGFLFHQELHKKYGCKGALNQAYVNRTYSESPLPLPADCYFRIHYFIAARRMVDLDQCRNILGLQTLLCFILFLMSTARLATAHTFVGLAVSASMRMGLHTQASCGGLSEFEKDNRRRVFWAVVNLEMYCSEVLGLPGVINLDYVDQPKPSGLPRDYAGKDQSGFAPVIARQAFSGSSQYFGVLLVIL